MRLRIEKLQSSHRRRAEVAPIAAAPDWRVTTITPSDRRATAAAPSDLGSIVNRVIRGRRRARLGGRPTLVHHGGTLKTEPLRSEALL